MSRWIKGSATVNPANNCENLRLVVYRRLRDEIVDLKYRPGETIAISEIARRMNVSRTPVREALNLLERDHLVRIMGQQGVLILEITIDEMIHILHLREVIDGLAARLAVNYMDDETLERFRHRFNALLALPKPDPDGQALLSRELHHSIAANSRNPYLLAEYHSLETAFARTNRQGWQVWKQSSRRDDVNRHRLAEHLAILEALSARDPESAERAARRHIVNSLHDLLTIVNGIPSSHVSGPLTPNDDTHEA